MDDAVSHALHARTSASEGLTKMLLVSVAAHAVVMTLAVLAPASFWLRPLDARAEAMTIDLGPAASTDSGGLTSIGARPVQRAIPDLQKVRPTPPPAAKTPDMALPEETRRVSTKPPLPSVNDAPKNAPGRTPAADSDVRAGNVIASTEAQSTSMGLSTRSAGGSAGAQLNVGDFCCPEYVATMLQRIHQHWNPGRDGSAVTTMRFTIQRDGTIAQVQMVRSSGNQMRDFLAQRALLAARQLPPLPDAYPHASLVVDLHFEQQR